jgi:hypothetical protein
LIANTIVGANNFKIDVSGPLGNLACNNNIVGTGLARLEAISNNIGPGNVSGALLTSLPFATNLPTSPPPVIAVTSINGIAVNANPFTFPDATINTGSPVPVVVTATNMPPNASVTIYLLSDSGANQAIPVTLTGTTASSTGTAQVTFPGIGTRGFVKATWSALGQ